MPQHQHRRRAPVRLTVARVLFGCPIEPTITVAFARNGRMQATAGEQTASGPDHTCALLADALGDAIGNDADLTVVLRWLADIRTWAAGDPAVAASDVHALAGLRFDLANTGCAAVA
jgi:hypothetical protein